MAGLPPKIVTQGEGRDWARELAPLGPRKLKVVWDISNKCNLRCRMCHFAFDEVFHRPADYMTPEVFERLAEQALPNAHTLILSAGNEPLTSPWFADILRIAARFEVPNLLFITNATRLTPRIAEAIIDCGVTQVQISIDGSTKETYESIRRGAQFEKLLQNISYLTHLKKQRGSLTPQLQFNIVLMKSNLEELDGFVDLAETLGVEWIAARHLLVMKGLGMEAETLFDDPERANHFFRKFLRRAEASQSVRVIGFPDLFDAEEMRNAAVASRLIAFDRPFGVVDMPIDSVTEFDSVVTLSGWVLDSDMVDGVTVERDRFTGETAEHVNERGLVPVTEARLGGERADVAALYPEFRNGSAAGWYAEIGQSSLSADLPSEVTLHIVALSQGRPPAELGVRRIRFHPRAASPDARPHDE